MTRKHKIFALTVGLTLLADQLAKYWARHSLSLGRPVPVISGYFDWDLSYNTGSAFGLFSGATGARIFLSVVGVVACIAILFILRKAEDSQKWLTAALGLVFGGALGNVIDRVLFGQVTDFVLWKIGTHRWPAFNVADATLVAGVLILFLDIGRDQKKKKERDAKAKSKESGRR